MWRISSWRKLKVLLQWKCEWQESKTHLLLIRRKFNGLEGRSNQPNIPLSQSLIQSKAVTLFNSVKTKRAKEAPEGKSQASRDWFLILKKPSLWYKVEQQVLMLKLQQVIQNIQLRLLIKAAMLNRFLTQKTISYWKKMHSRTFTAREKSMLASKHHRTRLLLIGANAAGNFNLKPTLIYHSENPSFTVFFLHICISKNTQTHA